MKLRNRGCILVLLALSLAVIVVARADSQSSSTTQKGLSTVWTSTSTSTPPASTEAYIDVLPWVATSNNDVCAAIYSALTSGAASVLAPATSQNGLVIDARSFPQPLSRNSINCNQNPFPAVMPPGVSILLPFGIIQLSQTLVLPQYVRIMGFEGEWGSTVLFPSSNFVPSDPNNALIEMGGTRQTCGNPNGTGVYDCQGIVIEHLSLGESSSTLNGIVNNTAEELSYVNDVYFNGFVVGLSVGVTTSGGQIVANANNSGPYTNIECVGSSVACISVQGTHSTRGFSSIASYDDFQSILLNAPNNTFQDVEISWPVSGSFSSSAGIIVGNLSNAQNNIIKNVRSGDRNIVVSPTIHISSQAGGGSTCPATPAGTVPNVCDLTIMNVSGFGTIIQDDLTNTQLTNPVDQTVSVYVLGEQVATGGTGVTYSRFTTSQSVPTWMSGSVAPTGSCTVGSLFSCTSSTCQDSKGNPAAFFGCVTNGSSTWAAIK